MSESIRIGQLLVEQGVLCEQQVLEILQKQRTQGVPFGVLAERLFDVTLGSIEQAWASQYQRMTGTIDLAAEPIDERVLGLISRRQAWQFEMIPLHYVEGDGELLIAATDRRLARAVTFVANRLEPVAYFRVADADQMRLFLQKHYPMPEVTQDMKDQARLFAGASPA